MQGKRSDRRFTDATQFPRHLAVRDHPICWGQFRCRSAPRARSVGYGVLGKRANYRQTGLSLQVEHELAASPVPLQLEQKRRTVANSTKRRRYALGLLQGYS
jgi:hypothetical protein